MLRGDNLQVLDPLSKTMAYSFRMGTSLGLTACSWTVSA